MQKINTNNMVVPLASVHANAWNPKRPYTDTPEGRKNWERLKKSIARHGQIDPLIVRKIKKGYEIINGFHRYCAAKELGWKEIEVKDLGKITDTRAKAIALATEDVRIPLEMASVAKIVKEIMDIDEEALDDLPYDEEDAKALQDMVEFDFKEPDEDYEAGAGDDEKDMGEYKITIPASLVPKWKKLLKAKDCSDVELITELINGSA
jgi:ParB/RepB/Spo0J family partition protein